MLQHNANESNGNVGSLLISVSGGGIRFRRITTSFGGHPPIRGPIAGLSESSVGRMRRYLRGCVADYRYMLTLTYPSAYPGDGRLVKDHLRRFLQESRRFACRDYSDGGRCPGAWSSFWFLEFQSRGAPHFHIFTTHQLPREWVAHTWYRIVASDDIRHLHAGTRIESLRSGRGGTVSYAMKYAAKREQKEVPPDYESVGRFWGVAGGRSVVDAAILIPPGETGPRTARTLAKLKETLAEWMKLKRAIRIVIDGVCRGFIIPSIADQFELCRQLHIIGAYGKAEGKVEVYYPHEAIPEAYMELIDNGGR